jgi:hypothetical protein
VPHPRSATLDAAPHAPCPDDEAALTEAIVGLAAEYGRYGYRRITAMLRTRGWHVNAKRVQRIWRREGLKVPRRQPKRGRLWLADGVRTLFHRVRKSLGERVQGGVQRQAARRAAGPRDFPLAQGSRGSDRAMAIATWQARPLEPVYPLVFFDALRVKIRDEGPGPQQGGAHRARCAGGRHQGDPGAVAGAERGRQFWLRVMNELKNRGVEDVLLAVVDGLKGFPEAILAVFPRRWCRPASCICCGTAWTSSPGRTASRWQPR